VVDVTCGAENYITHVVLYAKGITLSRLN
jgi:hypothetical protein